MYLGWDIGIKNLSYCLLKIVNQKNNRCIELLLNGKNVFIEIVSWDVINIVDNINSDNNEFTLSKRDKLNCSFNKCKKVSYFCLNRKINNQYVSYCRFHYNKLEDKTNYIELIKKPKCSNVNCSKNTTYIEKEHHYISYCTIHKKMEERTTGKEFIHINTKIKATYINLSLLGLSLYKELDKIPEIINNIDIVLLENQPVLINPTMKSVQMLVYAYFIMKGLKEKKVKEIKCYSANQKNTLISLLEDSQQEYIKDKLKDTKSKYTKNKKESIMITERIIKGNFFENKFNSSKKKDDLADSLLMTIHYITKQFAK